MPKNLAGSYRRRLLRIVIYKKDHWNSVIRKKNRIRIRIRVTVRVLNSYESELTE